MNNKIEQEVALEMVRMMNYRMHANILDVPVLDGFKVENIDNPQTILLASSNCFVEQLTSDGFVNIEDFQSRINFVIDSTKEFMKKSNCDNVDGSFIYYKDYNNGMFEFKIYVQDMILNIQNEKKVIRSFNAYFIEPKMKDFYQLSISAGPFVIPTEELKIGEIDLVNDKVSITLDNMLTKILTEIKYK